MNNENTNNNNVINEKSDNRPPLPPRPKPSNEPVMDITLKSLIELFVEFFKGSFQFWKHFFGC